MHFEISRAHKHGKQLTAAQRTSSLFAPEPVVLGKMLRRGGPPLKINEAQFRQNEITLKRLFDAGAIDIKVFNDKGTLVADFRDREAEKKVADKAPEALDELKEMKEPAPVAPVAEPPVAGDSMPPQEEQNLPPAPPVEVAPPAPPAAPEPVAEAQPPAPMPEEPMPSDSYRKHKKGRKE